MPVSTTQGARSSQAMVLITVPRLVEHIKIVVPSVTFAKKLTIEHLFFTISIATIQGTTFFHNINNQVRLTIGDIRRTGLS